MSNNLGNLELNILLKTDQLSAGAKAAISIIEQVAKAGNSIGVFDKIDFSKFTQEITKVASENAKTNQSFQESAAAEDKLKTSTDGATDSTAKFNNSQKDVSVTLGAGNTVAEKFSNALMRVGLMQDGLRSIGEGFNKLKTDFIDAGLRADVMKKHFTGTEEQLESFRIVTGRIADDATLIRISNQASDLGISLQDQTVMFYKVKDAADKYNTDLYNGFQKVIYLNEGATRILKQLGVQKEVYNKNIADGVFEYAKENLVLDENNDYLDENGEKHKLVIGLLPLEEQERIRINAFIKASNVTYDEAIKRQQTTADKMQMLSTVTKNAEESIGSFIGRGLVALMDNLKITNVKVAESTGTAMAMGKGLTDIIPIVASLIQIFPKLGTVISGSMGIAVGSVAAALAVIVAIGDQIVRIQNLLKGRGYTSDPLVEKSREEKTKENYRNAANINLQRQLGKKTKMGNLTSPFDEEDIQLEMGRLMVEDKKRQKYIDDLQKENSKKEIKNKLEDLTKQTGGQYHPPESVKEDTTIQDTITELNTKLQYLKLTGALTQAEAESQITSLRALDSENLTLDKRVSILEAIKTRVLDIIELQGEASGDYDGDIAARVKARLDAMRSVYEEKAGKLTKEGLKDERYKGFDEASAMKKAYQIERGLVDEKVSVDDLQNIIKFLDEGIIRLTGLKGQDDAIRQYTKERTETEKQLNKILEDRAKISEKNKELAIQTNKALSPEQKEIALIKLKYDIELQAIDKKIEAVKLLDKEQAKLFATQRKLTDAEKKQAVQDKIKAVNLGKLESLQSAVTDATQAFFGTLTQEGGTAGQALKALLKTLLNQLLTYVETKIVLAKVSASADAILTGGLSLLKDAPLLAVAIAALEAARVYVNSFHTGGAIPGTGDQLILAKGGEHMMNERAVNTLGHNFFDYLNSGGLPGRYSKMLSGSANPAVASSVREVPYIAETKLRGNDIAVVMRRAESKQLRRKS